MAMAAAMFRNTSNQSIVSTGNGSVLRWTSATNNTLFSLSPNGYQIIIPQSGYYYVQVNIFTSIGISCRAFFTAQSDTATVGARFLGMPTQSNATGVNISEFTFTGMYYLPSGYNLGVNVLPSANCTITYRSDSVTFSGPKLQIVQLTGAIE